MISEIINLPQLDPLGSLWTGDTQTKTYDYKSKHTHTQIIFFKKTSLICVELEIWSVGPKKES